WWLGKKKGKEAYVVHAVVDGRVEFSIGHDLKKAPTKDNDGTVSRTGAGCIGCGSAVPLSYVRAEGKAKRMGAQLMAIAAEGNRRRIYLPPNPEHEAAADVPVPEDVPDTEIPYNPRYLTAPNYGMTRHADLFTPRQLVALTTFSDLVKEARDKVLADALAAGMPEGDRLEAGGADAAAYADSVATYLGLGVSRLSDISNALCHWENTKTQVRHLFTRQAISMMWDFAETLPFGEAAGGYTTSLGNLAKSIDRIPSGQTAIARQASAEARTYERVLVSTDPPYYDNVGYADLSDFFYIWLRRSLDDVHQWLLSTVLTPKADELVADPFRRDGKESAQR